MERNVARADCPPVYLKADGLPNTANTELRRRLMTFSLLLTTKIWTSFL